MSALVRRRDKETKRVRVIERKRGREEERKRRGDGLFVLLLSAKCLLKLCLNAAMTLL